MGNIIFNRELIHPFQRIKNTPVITQTGIKVGIFSPTSEQLHTVQCNYDQDEPDETPNFLGFFYTAAGSL